MPVKFYLLPRKPNQQVPPYIDIAEKTKADAMKLIEDAWDR